VAARFKKSREASLVRADGVVWSRNFLTTPPRPSATPPPAEEGSFIGDRQALYRDWLWSRRGDSVIVSAWLLKRLNLVRHT
jgi:hypothetical protein